VKSHFAFTQTLVDRSDLLKQAEAEKGPMQDVYRKQRQQIEEMAAQKIAETARKPELRNAVEKLPPEQQAKWKAAEERYARGELGQKSVAAATPEEKARVDGLQKQRQDAYGAMARVTPEERKTYDGAMRYAGAWNKAADADRALDPKAPLAEERFKDKSDVLDGALKDPALTPEQKKTLQGERDRTEIGALKSKIAGYDKELEAIRSGAAVGDPKVRERLKANAQDKLARLEGTGAPTNQYQTERRQIDEERARIDADLAKERAKRPPVARGEAGQGPQGVTPAGDGGPSLKEKQLLARRAELDQKSGQLERDQRDRLKDHAEHQADQKTAEAEKKVDQLSQQRDAVAKQLADPALDPAKRADLEKQRSGFDQQIADQRTQIDKARQEAAGQSKDALLKRAEALRQEGKAARNAVFSTGNAEQVVNARTEAERAGKNLESVQRSLESAKKDLKALDDKKMVILRGDKQVPYPEARKELQDKVDGLEKLAADYTAKKTGAESIVKDAEVEQAKHDLEWRTKEAQATALEESAKRLNERLGPNGLPEDIERGIRNRDPQALQRAGEWQQQNRDRWLGPQEKADLKVLGREFGFDPVESRPLYSDAKNAEKAKADLSRAQTDATAAKQRAADAEAERRRVNGLPPTPPPDPKTLPLEPKLFPSKAPPAEAPPAKNDAAPPAAGTAPSAPKDPPKQREPINPALDAEDRKHLERQGKELEERGRRYHEKLQKFAGWLNENAPGVLQGGAADRKPGPGGQTQPPSFDLSTPEKMQDALHSMVKTALENPDFAKSLMKDERKLYGFTMQFMDTVEGLAHLGGEAAEGLADFLKDPKGQLSKAGDAIAKAADDPRGTAERTWEKTKQVAGHIKKAIADAYEKDPHEFAGRAAFEVVSLLFPASKAGTAGKGAEVLNAVEKAGEVARAAEKAGEVTRAAEKAVEVTRAAEKTAEAARATEKTAEAARAAEKASQAAKEAEKAATAARAKEITELERAVKAKEDAALRLRESLPGGRHPVEGPQGARNMSGAAGQTPEQIAKNAERLEREAEAMRKSLTDARAAAAKGALAGAGSRSEKLEALGKALGDLDHKDASRVLKQLAEKDLKGLEQGVIATKGDRLVFVDHAGKLQDVRVGATNAKDVLAGIKEGDEALRGAASSYDLRRAVLERSEGKLDTAQAYTKKPPSGPDGQPLSNSELWKWQEKPEAWIPERQALQQQIFDEGLKKAEALSKAAEPNTIYALRGNTAAGKSTAVRANEQFEKLADHLDGAINPDTYKDALRRADMREGKNTVSWSQSHSEGSSVSARIEKALLEKEGSSVVYDKRFAYPHEIPELLAKAERTGKKVKIVDLDVPAELSAARVLTREPHGNAPLVPWDNGGVAKGFEGVRSNRGEMIFGKDGTSGIARDARVTDYELWVANDAGQPVRVAAKKNGEWIGPKTAEEQRLFDRATEKVTKEGIEAASKQLIDGAWIDKMVSTFPPARQEQVRRQLEAYKGMSVTEALEKHSKRLN